MSSKQEPLKLTRLRAKTDRQLLQILTTDLEHGLKLAAEAGVCCDLGDRRGFEELRARAKRVYDLSRLLMPLIYGLSQGEAHRLEAKHEELKRVLFGEAVRVACL